MYIFYGQFFEIQINVYQYYADLINQDFVLELFSYFRLEYIIMFVVRKIQYFFAPQQDLTKNFI